MILSLLEARPRHGYEVSKLIDSRSGGRLRFHIASLYPLLYRLGGARLGRGPLGREARRAPARASTGSTRDGRRVLAAQRDNWREFVAAVARVTG